MNKLLFITIYLLCQITSSAQFSFSKKIRETSLKADSVISNTLESWDSFPSKGYSSTLINVKSSITPHFPSDPNAIITNGNDLYISSISEIKILPYPYDSSYIYQLSKLVSQPLAGARYYDPRLNYNELTNTVYLTFLEKSNGTGKLHFAKSNNGASWDVLSLEINEIGYFDFPYIVINKNDSVIMCSVSLISKEKTEDLIFIIDNNFEIIFEKSLPKKHSLIPIEVIDNKTLRFISSTISIDRDLTIVNFEAHEINLNNGEIKTSSLSNKDTILLEHKKVILNQSNNGSPIETINYKISGAIEINNALYYCYSSFDDVNSITIVKEGDNSQRKYIKESRFNFSLPSFTSYNEKLFLTYLYTSEIQSSGMAINFNLAFEDLDKINSKKICLNFNSIKTKGKRFGDYTSTYINTKTKTVAYCCQEGGYKNNTISICLTKIQ